MIAAVLPTQNEANTIASVAAAAAVAIGTTDAVMINVDASYSDETAQIFHSLSLPIRKQQLRLTEAGKGRQIFAGLRLVSSADCVLVIDTDTKNADHSTYEALISAVACGADLAIADYPRFWYEGNLSNHIIRPLLLATTGLDIPQPIAGDIALSHRAVKALLEWFDTTSAIQPILTEINGYGIDIAILLKCFAIGKLTPVRLDRPKRHAVSFPHYRQIYEEEVPVLLSGLKSFPIPLTTACDSSFRLDGGHLDDDQYNKMLLTLYDWKSGLKETNMMNSWPKPLFEAWWAVKNGSDIKTVTADLWPAYVQRTIDYLVVGQSCGITEANTMLAKGLQAVVDSVRDSANPGAAIPIK